MFELPRIRPLSEGQDIDYLIAEAGGARAHGDSDSKSS